MLNFYYCITPLVRFVDFRDIFILLGNQGEWRIGVELCQDICI